MRSGNDGAAFAVVIVGGVVLMISQGLNVPIPVTIDALPWMMLWAGAVALMMYLHQVEAYWPIAVGGIPWALGAILAHKYQGMWLGSEGGQNLLAITLIVAGYLFKWWRRPSY